VEVVAAGEAERLAELRESLKRGPRGSRIDKVIEHPLVESEGSGLNAFKIEGAW
jgi:acylphosphatase